MVEYWAVTGSGVIRGMDARENCVMLVPDRASVKFNDLIGTAAIDEEHAMGLAQLASDCGVPDGHMAVAFDLDIGEYMPGAHEDVFATVYAVEGGLTGDEDPGETLDVRRYEKTISVSRIPELFKRIAVQLRIKRFERTPLNVLED